MSENINGTGTPEAGGEAHITPAEVPAHDSATPADGAPAPANVEESTDSKVLRAVKKAFERNENTKKLMNFEKLTVNMFSKEETEKNEEEIAKIEPIEDLAHKLLLADKEFKTKTEGSYNNKNKAINDVLKILNDFGKKESNKITKNANTDEVANFALKVLKNSVEYNLGSKLNELKKDNKLNNLLKNLKSVEEKYQTEYNKLLKHGLLEKQSKFAKSVENLNASNSDLANIEANSNASNGELSSNSSNTEINISISSDSLNSGANSPNRLHRTNFLRNNEEFKNAKKRVEESAKAYREQIRKIYADCVMESNKYVTSVFNTNKNYDDSIINNLKDKIEFAKKEFEEAEKKYNELYKKIDDTQEFASEFNKAEILYDCRDAKNKLKSLKDSLEIQETSQFYETKNNIANDLFNSINDSEAGKNAICKFNTKLFSQEIENYFNASANDNDYKAFGVNQEVDEAIADIKNCFLNKICTNSNESNVVIEFCNLLNIKIKDFVKYIICGCLNDFTEITKKILSYFETDKVTIIANKIKEKVNNANITVDIQSGDAFTVILDIANGIIGNIEEITNDTDENSTNWPKEEDTNKIKDDISKAIPDTYKHIKISLEGMLKKEKKNFNVKVNKFNEILKCNDENEEITRKMQEFDKLNFYETYNDFLEILTSMLGYYSENCAKDYFAFSILYDKIQRNLNALVKSEDLSNYFFESDEKTDKSTFTYIYNKFAEKSYSKSISNVLKKVYDIVNTIHKNNKENQRNINETIRETEKILNDMQFELNETETSTLNTKISDLKNPEELNNFINKLIGIAMKVAGNSLLKSKIEIKKEIERLKKLKKINLNSFRNLDIVEKRKKIQDYSLPIQKLCNEYMLADRNQLEMLYDNLQQKVTSSDYENGLNVLNCEQQTMNNFPENLMEAAVNILNAVLDLIYEGKLHLGQYDFDLRLDEYRDILLRLNFDEIIVITQDILSNLSSDEEKINLIQKFFLVPKNIADKICSWIGNYEEKNKDMIVGYVYAFSESIYPKDDAYYEILKSKFDKLNESIENGKYFEDQIFNYFRTRLIIKKAIEYYSQNLPKKIKIDNESLNPIINHVLNFKADFGYCWSYEGNQEEENLSGILKKFDMNNKQQFSVLCETIYDKTNEEIFLHSIDLECDWELLRILISGNYNYNFLKSKYFIDENDRPQLRDFIINATNSEFCKLQYYYVVYNKESSLAYNKVTIERKLGLLFSSEDLLNVEEKVVNDIAELYLDRTKQDGFCKEYGCSMLNIKNQNEYDFLKNIIDLLFCFCNDDKKNKLLYSAIIKIKNIYREYEEIKPFNSVQNNNKENRMKNICASLNASLKKESEQFEQKDSEIKLSTITSDNKSFDFEKVKNAMSKSKFTAKDIIFNKDFVKYLNCVLDCINTIQNEQDKAEINIYSIICVAILMCVNKSQKDVILKNCLSWLKLITKSDKLPEVLCDIEEFKQASKLLKNTSCFENYSIKNAISKTKMWSKSLSDYREAELLAKQVEFAKFIEVKLEDIKKLSKEKVDIKNLSTLLTKCDDTVFKTILSLLSAIFEDYNENDFKILEIGFKCIKAIINHSNNIDLSNNENLSYKISKIIFEFSETEDNKNELEQLKSECFCFLCEKDVNIHEGFTEVVYSNLNSDEKKQKDKKMLQELNKIIYKDIYSKYNRQDFAFFEFNENAFKEYVYKIESFNDLDNLAKNLKIHNPELLNTLISCINERAASILSNNIKSKKENIDNMLSEENNDSIPIYLKIIYDPNEIEQKGNNENKSENEREKFFDNFARILQSNISKQINSKSEFQRLSGEINEVDPQMKTITENEKKLNDINNGFNQLSEKLSYKKLFDLISSLYEFTHLKNLKKSIIDSLINLKNVQIDQLKHEINTVKQNINNIFANNENDKTKDNIIYLLNYVENNNILVKLFSDLVNIMFTLDDFINGCDKENENEINKFRSVCPKIFDFICDCCSSKIEFEFLNAENISGEGNKNRFENYINGKTNKENYSSEEFQNNVLDIKENVINKLLYVADNLKNNTKDAVENANKEVNNLEKKFKEINIVDVPKEEINFDIDKEKFDFPTTCVVKYAFVLTKYKDEINDSEEIIENKKIELKNKFIESNDIDRIMRDFANFINSEECKDENNLLYLTHQYKLFQIVLEKYKINSTLTKEKTVEEQIFENLQKYSIINSIFQNNILKSRILKLNEENDINLPNETANEQVIKMMIFNDLINRKGDIIKINNIFDLKIYNGICNKESDSKEDDNAREDRYLLSLNYYSRFSYVKLFNELKNIENAKAVNIREQIMAIINIIFAKIYCENFEHNQNVFDNNILQLDENTKFNGLGDINEDLNVKSEIFQEYILNQFCSKLENMSSSEENHRIFKILFGFLNNLNNNFIEEPKSIKCFIKSFEIMYKLFVIFKNKGLLNNKIKFQLANSLINFYSKLGYEISYGSVKWINYIVQVFSGDIEYDKEFTENMISKYRKKFNENKRDTLSLLCLNVFQTLKNVMCDDNTYKNYLCALPSNLNDCITTVNNKDNIVIANDNKTKKAQFVFDNFNKTGSWVNVQEINMPFIALVYNGLKLKNKNQDIVSYEQKKITINDSLEENDKKNINDINNKFEEMDTSSINLNYVTNNLLLFDSEIASFFSDYEDELNKIYDEILKYINNPSKLVSEKYCEPPLKELINLINERFIFGEKRKIDKAQILLQNLINFLDLQSKTLRGTKFVKRILLSNVDIADMVKKGNNTEETDNNTKKIEKFINDPRLYVNGEYVYVPILINCDRNNVFYNEHPEFNQMSELIDELLSNKNLHKRYSDETKKSVKKLNENINKKLEQIENQGDATPNPSLSELNRRVVMQRTNKSQNQGQNESKAPENLEIILRNLSNVLNKIYNESPNENTNNENVNNQSSNELSSESFTLPGVLPYFNKIMPEFYLRLKSIVQNSIKYNDIIKLRNSMEAVIIDEIFALLLEYAIDKKEDKLIQNANNLIYSMVLSVNLMNSEIKKLCYLNENLKKFLDDVIYDKKFYIKFNLPLIQEIANDFNKKEEKNKIDSVDEKKLDNIRKKICMCNTFCEKFDFASSNNFDLRYKYANMPIILQKSIELENEKNLGKNHIYKTSGNNNNNNNNGDNSPETKEVVRSTNSIFKTIKTNMLAYENERTDVFWKNLCAKSSFINNQKITENAKKANKYLKYRYYEASQDITYFVEPFVFSDKTFNEVCDDEKNTNPNFTMSEAMKVTVPIQYAANEEEIKRRWLHLFESYLIFYFKRIENENTKNEVKKVFLYLLSILNNDEEVNDQSINNEISRLNDKTLKTLLGLFYSICKNAEKFIHRRKYLVFTNAIKISEDEKNLLSNILNNAFNAGIFYSQDELNIICEQFYVPSNHISSTEGHGVINTVVNAIGTVFNLILLTHMAPPLFYPSFPNASNNQSSEQNNNRENSANKNQNLGDKLVAFKNETDKVDITKLNDAENELIKIINSIINENKDINNENFSSKKMHGIINYIKCLFRDESQDVINLICELFICGMLYKDRTERMRFACRRIQLYYNELSHKKINHILNDLKRLYDIVEHEFKALDDQFLIRLDYAVETRNKEMIARLVMRATALSFPGGSKFIKLLFERLAFMYPTELSCLLFISDKKINDLYEAQNKDALISDVEDRSHYFKNQNLFFAIEAAIKFTNDENITTMSNRKMNRIIDKEIEIIRLQLDNIKRFDSTKYEAIRNEVINAAKILKKYYSVFMPTLKICNVENIKSNDFYGNYDKIIDIVTNLLCINNNPNVRDIYQIILNMGLYDFNITELHFVIDLSCFILKIHKNELDFPVESIHNHIKSIDEFNRQVNIKTNNSILDNYMNDSEEALFVQNKDEYRLSKFSDNINMSFVEILSKLEAINTWLKKCGLKDYIYTNFEEIAAGINKEKWTILVVLFLKLNKMTNEELRNSGAIYEMLKETFVEYCILVPKSKETDEFKNIKVQASILALYLCKKRNIKINAFDKGREVEEKEVDLLTRIKIFYNDMTKENSKYEINSTHITVNHINDKILQFETICEKSWYLQKLKTKLNSNEFYKEIKQFIESDCKFVTCFEFDIDSPLNCVNKFANLIYNCIENDSDENFNERINELVELFNYMIYSLYKANCVRIEEKGNFSEYSQEYHNFFDRYKKSLFKAINNLRIKNPCIIAENFDFNDCNKKTNNFESKIKIATNLFICDSDRKFLEESKNKFLNICKLFICNPYKSNNVKEISEILFKSISSSLSIFELDAESKESLENNLKKSINDYCNNFAEIGWLEKNNPQSSTETQQPIVNNNNQGELLQTIAQDTNTIINQSAESQQSTEINVLERKVDMNIASLVYSNANSVHSICMKDECFYHLSNDVDVNLSLPKFLFTLNDNFESNGINDFFNRNYIKKHTIAISNYCTDLCSKIINETQDIQKFHQDPRSLRSDHQEAARTQ